MTESTRRRLTEFSHGAGCGCKLGPAALQGVLGRLGPKSHPDLLVGSATGDDAAVWRIDDHRALVLTTDFFTPIVDDAHTWGRIAAANAVSDVYAMGARPLVALNLVAWSSTELPIELLDEVLQGAESIADEAGFLIAGGHSIDDPEPKYGLAVVGEVDPAHMLTNRGLRPGDQVVLTKPLGVGVITTGVKRALASPESTESAVEAMTTLNDLAASVAVAAGATGATDVTGFGLLGHLGRMAVESGVDVDISFDDVPFLPGARQLAEEGCLPGGTLRNREHARSFVDDERGDEVALALLADAQTSGGLVFGARHERAAGAVAELLDAGQRAAIIGEARPGTGRITVR